MTKGWRKYYYASTQQEVADEFHMSQQNVNDAQLTGLRKVKEGILNIYTEEEILQWLREKE